MNIKKYTYAALSVAIVCVATICIVIPINGVGYVNIGDSAIMLLAGLFDPKTAILIGGLGSALADISLGYAHYALFTLVIKGLEAATISYLIRQGHRINYSYLIAGLMVIGGYYLTDVFLTQNMIAPLSGVITNIIQIGVCMLIANLLAPITKRLKKQFFK